MNKFERGRLLLAILGTIGAIAVLMILFGCGARNPIKPLIGAPPNPEGQCTIGYQYNHWSQKCEKYPSEGIHGCGVEVLQANGSIPGDSLLAGESLEEAVLREKVLTLDQVSSSKYMSNKI